MPKPSRPEPSGSEPSRPKPADERSRPDQAHAEVGVLLLDNELPRPIGDVGNPDTFDYPIDYRTIPGADTRRVVERQATGLADTARRSAEQLASAGVRAISTCCGFLAIFQRELSSAVDIPVATSSLLQIPLILRTLRPHPHLVVLTVNGSTLTDTHFAAAGIGSNERARITVVGLENTRHFYPMIIGEITELDVARAEAEVVTEAIAAVDADPAVGAFVFECTNLPPYAAAVRRATGLPVWDATHLINWLHDGVAGSAG